MHLNYLFDWSKLLTAFDSSTFVSLFVLLIRPGRGTSGPTWASFGLAGAFSGLKNGSPSLGKSLFWPFRGPKAQSLAYMHTMSTSWDASALQLRHLQRHRGKIKTHGKTQQSWSPGNRNQNCTKFEFWGNNNRFCPPKSSLSLHEIKSCMIKQYHANISKISFGKGPVLPLNFLSFSFV